MHKSVVSFSSLLLLFLSQIAAAASLVVEKAWIPEMPPVSRVMGGFATIRNTSDQPVNITAISSPAFKSVEMHLSSHENGMMRMIPQKQLTIGPKSTLELKHGSYHLMLFNPVKPLKAGEIVDFTATLSNGETLTFKSQVMQNSGNAEQHHHHENH